MAGRDIKRRDFLGSAAAGVASLPAAEKLAAAIPARAETHAGAAPAVTPQLARFARRLDLIRPSLDVPALSAAILHKQTVILARGFGLADIARGIKASDTTPYPIASLTKTFAAAVLMKLVEAGKLDLDKPMADYDPGYAQWCAGLKGPNKAGWPDFHCDSERITVRQHLSHTAQGAPGTKFAYSSVLFARLAAVIDAVSDKGFVRALEEDIIAPLGMNDTALGSKDPHKGAVVARMAEAYRLDRDWNPVAASEGRSFDHINAAAGIISTVADLARYDIGIDRNLVYSAAVKEQIWTPTVTPSGEKLPYGLGWFVQGEPGTKSHMVWHYGLYPNAFSSLLFKLPQQELTLILLASTERASSVFLLGNGDPLRSAFVTAFLDGIAREA